MFRFFGGFVLFLVLCTVIFRFFDESVQSSPSDDVDTILKHIGSQYVKQTLDNAKNIDEAARIIGIDSVELKRICTALNIDIPGEIVSEKIEPVVLSTAEKLANNYYEPDVILNYNGTSPYLILVDKEEHQLHLLHYNDGKRTIIKSFECKTGKNHGDKKVEGDNRTPEGAYQFVAKYSREDIVEMVGRDQAFMYGDMAFATDFPNSIDRMHNKNGGGIWLHGTDKNFEDTSPNDTRGCVVTTNEDINTLSKYIKLYSTPIIIVDKLNMVRCEDIEPMRDNMFTMIESWRTAWETKNIDEYQRYYDLHFESQGMNKKQWIERKKLIFDAYDINHIRLDNYSIFRQNSGIVVQFIQDYSAENIKQNIGVKTLYLMPKEKNSWGIITEHFRRM